VAKYITAVQKSKQISDAAIKSLASQRGDVYLDQAKKYRDRGDRRNALSTAQEGLRLVSGPFYLAVRDQLTDFVEQLNRAA
jgi:hypothetical protein